MTKQETGTAQRKKDHINLAFDAKVGRDQVDDRFYYEPMLHAHPHEEILDKSFLGKTLQTPIWISSMTGGTEKGQVINENLARACRDFGMGMGLGSCRSLLYSDEHLDDFNVRKYIGDHLPLYGNLGIAQLEVLVAEKDLPLIDVLIDKLQLDGLIVHINPMQEWFQPEGDKITKTPLDTIKKFLDHASYPIIVKEVGQGMGLESLTELLQLPLAAIDFGASGGTNFALLELLRSDDDWLDQLSPLVKVGHTAEEMVQMVNKVLNHLGMKRDYPEIIISGGIKNFLDGYYLMSTCKLNSIYGQAAAFLKYATESYDQLYKFVELQKEGLKMAHTFLKVKL